MNQTVTVSHIRASLEEQVKNIHVVLNEKYNTLRSKLYDNSTKLNSLIEKLPEFKALNEKKNKALVEFGLNKKDFYLECRIDSSYGSMPFWLENISKQKNIAVPLVVDCRLIKPMGERHDEHFKTRAYIKVEGSVVRELAKTWESEEVEKCAIEAQQRKLRDINLDNTAQLLHLKLIDPEMHGSMNFIVEQYIKGLLGIK